MEQVTPHNAQPITKNAYDILMYEAGRLVWPEKYEIVRKNNRQKLHNDVIELLQEKNMRWTKQNVLSKGRPFVLQHHLYCNLLIFFGSWMVIMKN